MIKCEIHEKIGNILKLTYLEYLLEVYVIFIEMLTNQLPKLMSWRIQVWFHTYLQIWFEKRSNITHTEDF